MSEEWVQVGTVEVLKSRIYPIDPVGDPSPLRTTVAVEPGTYPVYRKFDAFLWLMRGRVNERNAKLGDGLFMMSSGDKPTGVEVQFPSQVFGPDQFAEFMADPICQPGIQQRLRFNVEASA